MFSEEKSTVSFFRAVEGKKDQHSDDDVKDHQTRPVALRRPKRHRAAYENLI